MLKQFSEETAALAAQAAKGLVHIGGPRIPVRTGIIWKDGLVLSLARQAEDGETVEIHTPDHQTLSAQVQSWDSRTGLVILKAPGLQAPAWNLGTPGLPGHLALTVAYASPAGYEVRLDALRFVQTPAEWVPGVPVQHLVQTDGPSFPGFSGAVILNPQGQFIAWIAENRPGNQGFAIGAQDLLAHAETLLKKGTRRRPYLGITGRPGTPAAGFLILSVEDQSPAAAAGWQPGDLILEIAQQGLTHPSSFYKILGDLESGQTVPVKILRGTEVQDRPIQVGHR